MPWHVSKSSECPDSKPWAVIKDSDSSVVACHESEESANDQLAALYASEERQAVYVCECLECGEVVESEEHCVDIVCPECGGEMRRKERPGEGRQMGDDRGTLWDLWRKFKNRMQPNMEAQERLYRMAQAELFRAIGMARIHEQLWMLLDAGDTWAWLIDIYIGDDWIYALVTREGKLYRIDLFLEDEQLSLGEWVQVTEIHPPVTQRMTVYRQADERWRWLNISGTAVLNRVGEIDSKELFDNMAKRAAETGEYPYRTFYHLGEAFQIGQADLLARDGALYITSGIFEENPLAQAIVRAIRDEPDYWGDSIGYLPLSEPDMVEVAEGVKVPVYSDGIHREISTLPEQKAASLFTMPSVQQEVNRMKPDVLEALERLRDKHGLEQEDIDEFVALADQTNRSIDDEDLIIREGDEEQVPDPKTPDGGPEPQGREGAGEPPAPEEDLEVELDEEAMDAIVDRVARSDLFAEFSVSLEGIQKRLAEISESTGSMVKRVDDADERLADLEKDEDEKQREWLADQSRRNKRSRTVRVTHRPREVNKKKRKGDGEPEGSLADEAESTLASMPRY